MKYEKEYGVGCWDHMFFGGEKDIVNFLKQYNVNIKDKTIFANWLFGMLKDMHEKKIIEPQIRR